MTEMEVLVAGSQIRQPNVVAVAYFENTSLSEDQFTTIPTGNALQQLPKLKTKKKLYQYSPSFLTVILK